MKGYCKVGAWLGVKRGKLVVLAAAISVVAVAGCSSGQGGDDVSPKPQNSNGASGVGEVKESGDSDSVDQPLAEVRSNGITLTVDSAVRDDGGFLTVSGTVNNGTGGIWVAGEWKSDETELKKNGGSLAGASLVDAAGKKKYLVLRDTSGRCLCTKFEGGIEKGQSADWFAQFPSPPDDTKKAEFQVGTMPPATIEISEG
ncbi:hypothetical protein G3M55_75660 [Streptomyces sp. SID8455]|nr:hypothetical protein [Streptomyces sp. SID8455]